VPAVDLRQRLGAARGGDHQVHGLAALVGQAAHRRLGERDEVAAVVARPGEAQQPRPGPHLAAGERDEPVPLEDRQRVGVELLPRAGRALEDEGEDLRHALGGVHACRYITVRGPRANVNGGIEGRIGRLRFATLGDFSSSSVAKRMA
jgi:hypothetical protein